MPNFEVWSESTRYLISVSHWMKKLASLSLEHIKDSHVYKQPNHPTIESDLMTTAGRSLLSLCIPHRIHLIPDGFHSFQMEYILAGIPLFLVIPFHLYSIWNGQTPSGFHHSIWNVYLDSTWNDDVDSTTIPLDSKWIPNGFHNIRIYISNNINHWIE